MAHKRTGHHIWCGMEDFPCAQCEAQYEQITASMDRGQMLVELGRLLDADAAAAEHEPRFMRWANIYVTLIQPGRCGDLWTKPQWLVDVARIGDDVWHEVERRALKGK